MTDIFATVAGDCRIKTGVGACRFIASVKKTANEEQARLFINEVSQEFADATHNAYAYKIGTGHQAICRLHDAGEPAGTAGSPILQAINSAGLTNVTIVASRYFGGVKLGIGGLVRAYRSCAKAGLRQAGMVLETHYEQVLINLPYHQLGQALRQVAAFSGEVDGVIYRERNVVVKARVSFSLTGTFKNELFDLTGGKTEITIGNNIV